MSERDGLERQAVDERSDVQVQRILVIVDGDVRSRRGVCVNVFPENQSTTSSSPTRSCTWAPCGGVVAGRVPGNVLRSLITRRVTCPFTDDRQQFGHVVDFPGVGDDRLAVSHERLRVLQEL